MILKHKQIEIPKDNPFENCKLGREKYSNILTEIVGSYADGFVLAIDNKWGTGKTTFIQMWRQQLINNGFQTVLFNAWEHDFDDKPLPAILAELKELVGSNKDDLFKEVSEKASTIVKKVLPAAVKALAKYLGAAEMTQELAKSLSEGVSDMLDEEIKEYAKKKKGLIEFRDALGKYVGEIKGERPLVFIIDELDRCRPNYAVEVLEQIKHFFSVPGIVFVLSVDKEQLGHAVRGVYGTDLIDADEYLRRFIDVEYSLPKPLLREFCDYLSEYYNLNSFFEDKDRKRIKGISQEIKSFNSVSSILFDSSELTLRQVEKMYAIFRILLGRYNTRDDIYPEAMIFLIYCRFYKKEFFDKLSYLKIKSADFDQEFMKIIPKSRNHSSNQEFLKLQAMILVMNESLYTLDPRRTLFNNTELNTKMSKFTSSLELNKETFGREIDNAMNKYSINGDITRKLLNLINTFGEITR